MQITLLYTGLFLLLIFLCHCGVVACGGVFVFVFVFLFLLCVFFLEHQKKECF